MRKLFIYLGIACLFFLAGCNTSTPEPTPEPTTPAPTEEPTPVPSPVPTEVVDFCVDCHTDKEQLIATAKPEEAVEEESSGVG